MSAIATAGNPDIRTVIASDGAVVRAGLRAVATEAGLEVVAALDATAAIDEAVRAASARLVLAAPVGTDGEALFRALRHLPPGCRALVVLAVPGYRLKSGVLRRRFGLGSVPLDVEAHALRDSVTELFSGNGHAALAIEALCVGPGGALSHREQQVLAELAQGLGNQAIAERLYLSPATVKSHLRKIYRKLGVRTRSEAVALYVGELGAA